MHSHIHETNTLGGWLFSRICPTPPPETRPVATWYHKCIWGAVKCLHSLWSLHRFWHSLSWLGGGDKIQKSLFVWGVNLHLWEVPWKSDSSTSFCILDVTLKESCETSLQMLVWVKQRPSFQCPRKVSPTAGRTPIISRLQSCFTLWWEVLQSGNFLWVVGSRHVAENLNRY